jgi:hypothetical protein
VGAFPEPSETATTIRERLEAHRANPACKGCHDQIDPVGLAFEHFDGVGQYRDFDGTTPIDATGTLPDGTAIDGVDELARVLADDPRFPACVVRKLFTWTHGRAPRDADAPFLADAEAAMAAGGGTLEALIVALTTSDTFRLQEAP